MKNTKTYSCGCCFETDSNGRVLYVPDITKLPLDCSATWDMICEGNTKGVFQLESQLGRSLASQAKPRNIEELSDLIAIMRPGCLEAMVKGKSLKGIQLYAPPQKAQTFKDQYLISGIPRFILLDKEGKIINANAPRPSGNIRDVITKLEGI